MDHEYEQLQAQQQLKKKRFILLGSLFIVLSIVFIIVAATTPHRTVVHPHGPVEPEIPSKFVMKYHINDLDDDDGDDPGSMTFDYRGIMQRSPGDDPEDDLHWHYFDDETEVMPDGTKMSFDVEYHLWKGGLYMREVDKKGNPIPGSDAWSCSNLQVPLPRSITGALATKKHVEPKEGVKPVCAEGDVQWKISVAGVSYQLCVDSKGVPTRITDGEHFILEVDSFEANEQNLPDFKPPAGVDCSGPSGKDAFRIPEKFSFDYKIVGVDDEDDTERFSYDGTCFRAPGDEVDDFRFDYNETQTDSSEPGPPKVRVIPFVFVEDDLYAYDEPDKTWSCSPLSVPLPKSISAALSTVKETDADPERPCKNGDTTYTINIAGVNYQFCANKDGAPSSVWNDHFVMSITAFNLSPKLPDFAPPEGAPKDCTP